MTDQDPTVPGQTYRIGAVSRLTGVPADTLRVWERRYHAVTPIRSEAGTRLYAAEEVGRLILIKRLVDRGDAISSVANLALAGLRERMRGAELSERSSAVARPCRVAVCGAYLANRLGHETGPLDGIDLIGCFPTRETFLAASFDPPPDVVVLEFPILQVDQVDEIGPLLNHARAARAIVVYGFASRSALRRLASVRLRLLRAPVDIDELYRCCRSLSSASPSPTAPEAPSDHAMAGPLLPRRFADADLARIAATSASDDCDCAGHLVDLILAVTAFESYSQVCEIRRARDAALHADLHARAARARALLESALERVVFAEGLARAGKD